MAKAEDGKIRRPTVTMALVPPFSSAEVTIEPFLETSNRLLAAWASVSNELLEFGKARLDRSMAMSKALAQSASLDEAIELQSQYARSVMQDYVAEASKIVDLGTRSLLDSISPLRAVPETVAKHAEAAE